MAPSPNSGAQNTTASPVAGGAKQSQSSTQPSSPQTLKPPLVGLRHETAAAASPPHNPLSIWPPTLHAFHSPAGRSGHTSPPGPLAEPVAPVDAASVACVPEAAPAVDDPELASVIPLSSGSPHALASKRRTHREDEGDRTGMVSHRTTAAPLHGALWRARGGWYRPAVRRRPETDRPRVAPLTCLIVQVPSGMPREGPRHDATADELGSADLRAATRHACLRAGAPSRAARSLLAVGLAALVTTRDARAGSPAIDQRRADCLARNQDAPARYRELVRAFCAEHAALAGTGASLAVGERGALRFVATAGVACRGGAPIDADTGFRIGSLTKLLTAALAMTLVDEGRIDLDAPLAALVPEFAGPALSLRHLLSHTAGLPDPPAAELGADDDWLVDLAARPRWSEPGALWSYSSAGYALVGLALERATGSPYATLLHARVLAPLGLARATADLDLALRTGPACGHLGRGEQARELDLREDLALGAAGAAWTIPAGGVVASAAELVRGVLGLVDPVRSPLSAGAIAALLAPEAATHERPGERYGLGVRVQPPTGEVALYAHSGDTGDFTADLYFAPDRGFALVILSNGGDHLRATAAAGLHELLGVAARPPAPPSPPNHYLGDYEVPGWTAPAHVDQAGDLLTLTAPDLDLSAAPLAHAGDHRFRTPALPGTLTFVFTDEPGRASHLRGRSFVAARRP